MSDELDNALQGIVSEVDLEVKLLRVLTSCRTEAQSENAVRYFTLVSKKDPQLALRVERYLRDLDVDNLCFGKSVPAHISRRVPLAPAGFYIPGTGYDHGLQFANG